MARKPLNEALVQELVYGKTEPVKADKEAARSLVPLKTTKRFTIDLPVQLHTDFSILAIRIGKDKAEIVRELIQIFLTQNETLS